MTYTVSGGTLNPSLTHNPNLGLLHQAASHWVCPECLIKWWLVLYLKQHVVQL